MALRSLRKTGDEHRQQCYAEAASLIRRQGHSGTLAQFSLLSPDAPPNLFDMGLRDRVRRWWSPAKWRDEHPEVSDGEGFALPTEQRGTDTRGKETLTKPTDTTAHGRRH